MTEKQGFFVVVVVFVFNILSILEYIPKGCRGK